MGRQGERKKNIYKEGEATEGRITLTPSERKESRVVGDGWWAMGDGWRATSGGGGGRESDTLRPMTPPMPGGGSSLVSGLGQKRKDGEKGF